MAVYILQFSEPLHHARFYVGYCADGRVEQRLREHESGRGAAICWAAVKAGIKLRLLVVLPGFKEEETRIKRRKNTPKYVAQLRRQGVIQ